MKRLLPVLALFWVSFAVLAAELRIDLRLASTEGECCDSSQCCCQTVSSCCDSQAESAQPRGPVVNAGCSCGGHGESSWVLRRISFLPQETVAPDTPFRSSGESESTERLPLSAEVGPEPRPPRSVRLG